MDNNAKILHARGEDYDRTAQDCAKAQADLNLRWMQLSESTAFNCVISDSGVAEKTDLIPVALPDVTTFTDIELTPDHLTNQLRDCSQGKCKFCKKEIIDGMAG